MNRLDDIPECFCCPITNAIMTDPVMGNDGHSYEKDALVKWLSKNPISPITRDPMKITDLIPNRNLLSCIEIYLKSKLEKDSSIDINYIKKDPFISELYNYGCSKKPINICIVVNITKDRCIENINNIIIFIILILNDNDNLAIITSKSCPNITKMNEASKKKIINELNLSKNSESINKQDIIFTGLDRLIEGSNKNRSILLYLSDDPINLNYDLIDKYREPHQEANIIGIMSVRCKNNSIPVKIINYIKEIRE